MFTKTFVYVKYIINILNTNIKKNLELVVFMVMLRGKSEEEKSYEAENKESKKIDKKSFNNFFVTRTYIFKNKIFKIIF